LRLQVLLILAVAQEAATSSAVQGVPKPPPKPPSIPGDCSSNHTATRNPPFFATCKSDGGCLRITVGSKTRTTLNLGNTTANASVSTGVQWCVDHTNSVAYAKVNPQPQNPPYNVAYFEIDDDASPGARCKFLATHWTTGDNVHVLLQQNMTCTRDYVPSQLPGSDGVTNVTITVK